MATCGDVQSPTSSLQELFASWNLEAFLGSDKKERDSVTDLDFCSSTAGEDSLDGPITIEF